MVSQSKTSVYSRPLNWVNSLALLW